MTGSRISLNEVEESSLGAGPGLDSIPAINSNVTIWRRLLVKFDEKVLRKNFGLECLIHRNTLVELDGRLVDDEDDDFESEGTAMMSGML